MTPQLLDDALVAMSALHESLEPNNNEQQDATVLRRLCGTLLMFTRIGYSGLSNLLFERKRYAELPSYGQLQTALQNMVSAQHAGPITDEMCTAWTAARGLLKPFGEVSHA